MERREVAESALKHMCGRIGVPYSTESSEPVEGAWFLTTVGRNRVNIEAWSNGGHVGGRGVSQPLGSYGVNLTHEEAYDRLWFADRCFTAQRDAVNLANPARDIA
jgi:hypothetical protein